MNTNNFIVTLIKSIILYFIFVTIYTDYIIFVKYTTHFKLITLTDLITQDVKILNVNIIKMLHEVN